MESKREKSQLNRLKSMAVGAVLIAALTGGWYSMRLYQDRRLSDAMLEEYQAATEEASETSIEEGTEVWSQQQDIPADLLGQEVVQWNGVRYRRNTYMKAILCLGVDRRDDMTEYRGFNEAGQADAVFLLAQDTARNTLKVLMIPRDTMTEIGIIHPDMSSAGTEVRQLALAYANGDGREGSCENTVEAAEGLLHGFQIDHYLAADMETINLLNDAVGGVTVTVPTAGMEEKNPAFVKGTTITLHGEMAEQFVRYRDIENDYSAMYRMDQQQEYMTGFFEAVKERSRQDSQIVARLFDQIQDHMVTDMTKDQYLKLAADALTEGSLGREDFYTLPGSSMTTEVYEEYYADEKGSIQVMLDLFYRESSL